MSPSDPAVSGSIVAIDADFGKLAIAMGSETWGLPEFDLRMTGFLCIAGDLCHGFPDLAFQAHVGVSFMNGVSPGEIREVLIQLSPNVGYVMGLQALKRLDEIRVEQEKRGSVPSGLHPGSGTFSLPAAVASRLRGIDPWMFASLERQVSSIWSRPGLTHAERALLNVAVDLFYGSLGPGLECDVLVARHCGVAKEQLLALPRFTSEFSVPRALDGAVALRRLLSS